MKKSIVEVSKSKDSDRICRCCNNEATTMIELGQDFMKFTQVNSIYLCTTHTEELKNKLTDKI